MNYIVPFITTIVSIIWIKKKYNYPMLILIGIIINYLVWPNIPSTHDEYIYYLIATIVATIIGYNISNLMN